jgi:hypothetical protein
MKCEITKIGIYESDTEKNGNPITDELSCRIAWANGVLNLKAFLTKFDSFVVTLDSRLKIENFYKLCSGCRGIDKVPMRFCSQCNDFYCPAYGSVCSYGATHVEWNKNERDNYYIHTREFFHTDLEKYSHPVNKMGQLIPKG